MPAPIGISWCGTKLVVFRNQPIMSRLEQHLQSSGDFQRRSDRKPAIKWSYQLQKEVLSHRPSTQFSTNLGSPKNLWQMSSANRARGSISRGNSTDGRILRVNPQRTREQPKLVDVYDLSSWLFMTKEQVAAIDFNHLQGEIDCGAEKAVQIVLTTIDSTLETKLRPISRHLLQELKSVITSLYVHYEARFGY